MKSIEEKQRENSTVKILSVNKNRRTQVKRATGFAVLLILIIVSACLFLFRDSFRSEKPVLSAYADEYSSWTATVDAASTADNPAVYKLTGDITGTANSTNGFSTAATYYYRGALNVPAGKFITIDLNGHRINRNCSSKVTANSYCIYVSGTLKIIDSSADKLGVITGGNSNTANTTGGIYVAANGNVTLESGTISGSKTTGANCGAAVYLYAATSTFTMNGGEISGNTSTGATSSGAVYANAGKVFLNGGKITGNSGVTANGVFLYGSGSTLTMTGGSIADNTASSAVGGLYVNNGATADITAGKITGNVGSTAGGVFVNTSGRLNLGGSPQISGNTNTAAADRNIFINVPANSAAGVNLYLTSPLTGKFSITRNAVGPFTSGWADNGANAEFVLENANYQYEREADDPAPVYGGDELFLYNYNESKPNWLYYQPLAVSTKQQVTITLYSDWYATANSANGFNSDATNGGCYYNGGLHVPAGADIILDLNGHILSRNCTAVVANCYNFYVAGKLTVKDSDPDATHTGRDDKGGIITGGYSNTNRTTGGFYVYTTGDVTLEGGTVTGNRTTGTHSGAAVYLVNNASSRFTLAGGVITGNTATGNNSGGAFYLYSSSRVTVTDGEISYNNSTGTTTGGAMYVNSGAVVEVTGGSIIENVGKSYGGIYGVAAFTFRLGGSAEIKDNKLSTGVERNIYLTSGTVNVISPIASGLKYGVTRNALGALTSNFGANNPTVSPDEVFYTENTGYLLINDRYGDLDAKASPTAEATLLHKTSNIDNWNYLLGVSSASTPVTFTILDTAGDWFATATTSPKYITTLGAAGTGYTDANGTFFYGALNVPSGKYVTIDLNGFTISRNLGATGYNYGNVIRVAGHLVIRDTSASGKHYGVVNEHAEKVAYSGDGGLITGAYTLGANGLGGGIWQVSGSTTIESGTISGNRVSNTGYAGGVYVAAGNFAMTGGTIKDNTGGYGVYVNGGGTVTLDNNASIINNTGNYGLYMASAACTFNLGGSARVYGNTNSAGTAMNVFMNQANVAINLTSKLTKPASASQKMGITRNRADYFTDGWSTLMGNANPTDYFFCENETYEVVVALKYGEAQLISYDNYILWRSAVEASVMHGTTETVKLCANWGAAAHSTYTTSFAAGTFTVETGSIFYGALNVPSTAKIILDLNGYTIDRALGSAYAYGYVMIVRGSLEIIDSRGSGKITGGFCSGVAGGVNLVASSTFTMTAGTITGNKATQGAGVYMASGAVFNLGGTAQIKGNTTSAGAAANIRIVSATGAINIISKLSDGAVFGVTRSAVGEITSGLSATNPSAVPYETFVSETSAFTVIEWDTGTSKEAYMLATDNYTNWIYYLGLASTTNTQTVKLVSDWTAHSQTSSPNYRTSFDAVNTSHQADTDIFFYGALQVPANKSIILDLNGYTLNRAMPSAYAYGNVIRVLGQLTIIDSSQSQTGKITGGYTANASRAGAIWHVSGSLTMTGGTITGNRSSVATASNGIWITAGSFTMTGGTITGNTGGNSAVYMAAGTTFNAGGSAKIYDNPGNLVFANNSLMVNVISPFKAGARIAVTRTTNNYTATEGTVFTSGYGLYNSDDPSKYFLNTSSHYKVINYGSGSGLEGAMWTIDNATNWQHALTASTATAPKTFILYSDWTASTDSKYVRTFGASETTYTDVAGIYFYGALNVPSNKSIIINLNGYTIDRNLSSAYAYGYTLVNRGTTEIIDTSSARTGKITGAWCSGIAGGIYNVSGTLTVNGGTVTGNKATTGAGVYIAAGTLNIGGRVKITGNTNASGAARNIYIAGDRAKINIVSRLTGGQKFGVSKSNTGNGTFTSGFATYNAGVAVADMFVSENATLRLMTDDDGEGYLLSTDNYTNWNYFLGLSTATNTQTVVLTSDWIAHTQTGSGHNYATSFGGQDVAYTADTDYYYYGALQVPANKSIILDLNGYKLSRNLAGGSSRSHGYVLRVLGELIIIDSSLAKSGEITGGYSITASTGGAIWQVSGSLTVRAGTITGNHTTVASAGAVWVTAGTFTMTGGAITANTCASTGLSAGLYVAGGGTVNVGNSVRICDNAAKDVVFANTSKMINVVEPLVRGARIGVIRDNNNFTQTDGARFTEGYGQHNSDDVTNYFYASNSSSYKVITYGSGTDTEAAMWCINNFTNWQRAVDASSATVTQTFILYSDWTAAPCSSSYNYQTSFGTIGTQYTATDGKIYYGALQVPSGRSVQIDLNGFTINRALTSAYGQGYVIVNRGNLTITDSSKKQTGKITGGFSSGTAMAGGVWSAAGSLTLLSGNITGNKAPNGGGVYVTAGTFNLGGNIKVNGNTNSAGAARNIWLYASGVINVTSRLANGVTYGITRNGVGIFTNGFSANNPGVESPDVFFSENAAYFVYDDETTENVESGMMANNPTLNWQFFVNASLKNKGKTYTVTLGDNWNAVAQTSSPNYRMTFGNKGTYYSDANGAYFYGAIQVPAGASMILDLNGHTINRGLTAHYSYGYVIINRGTLTIIDSSEEQTGEIRGGWYNSNGAGIYNMGNLYLQAGKVTGNNGYGVHVYSGTVEMTGGFVTENSNYGIYVNSSASLKLGGSAKVYNGGTVNTSYPEGNLNVGFASASALISITSRFEEGARIGVTRDNNNFTSTLGSKFTSGYPNYNSEPVTEYFFASDTLRYRVQEYGDSGEAAMWCIDNYTNWQRAVAASSTAAPKTFIMYSDWTAQPCTASYNYQTSFGAIGTDYRSTSGYFFYGALQVPSGKNVIIDLNGYTINRALGVAYSYGYVVMIRGSLTIIDSSEKQTGTITGGWNSGGAGSVYLNTGSLTITGGTITGNKATAGAGVYVAAGTLSLGGNPRITGNTTAAGVDCNIYIPATNVIKIISPLTGDSKYGITRNGNGVFTSGLSKYNSGAPEDYFVSESISFEVIEEVNGDIVEASMLSTVPTTNWTYFVNKSLADGKTYTVKLRDDWIAKAQSSPNYRTSFISGGTYTSVSLPYFRGSLQVPAGAKIILDLNGFTLSRNLTAGYSYGYNIIVRGELTVIDSSASQNGKITMGYCSSTGAGGVYVNGGKLTVLGGSITGNKGAKAGGVYVSTATGITVGEAAKIYDNTVNATTAQSNVVLLNAASVVNVNSEFNAAAYTEDGTVTPKIGVTKSVNNTSSASVNLVTKGYGQYNSVTPANYFFADDVNNFMVSDYKENTDDWEGMMLNLNPANNWVNAINASLSNGSTQTVKLYKDWDAGTSSNYTTTFGANTNTNHYRYGALYVPNGAKIVLDLNGHSVNRNLKTARANGYVIIVYGTLTVIDSSANGDGKITGGKCNNIAGGVYLYQGSFTMTGGEITGNVATNGAGVYVRTGSFSLGGSTRIYDNKNAASEQKNIYLPNSGVINIVSELTGGMKLGVSRNAVGVFTKDYGKYHTTSPTNYFTSEYLDAAKGQGFRVVNFGTGTNLEGSMLGFNLIDNWNYAVTASITYEEAQTFDLFTNWTAATNSTYKTAFGTLSASYKTGGLYVPKGANVILNLNGNILNRNNTSRYAIYVEGTLTIIDIDDDGNPLSSGIITGGNYGIYIMNGGTVNLQGGTVRGNSAYGVYDDSGAGLGGGFNMTGGAVTANTTYGVYESTGTFTMTGGSVYGNGKVGVYVGEKGKLALGGKAVISTASSSAGSNLYFEDISSVIDIVSAFETGADVRFLRTGLGKLTDGWTTFNASADFNNFLTSENTSYNMELKDGEIYITSEDGAVNWQHAVDTSLKSNDFETCVLYKEWTADDNSDYTTAFGLTSAFVNGALYVPVGAKVILDLSGFDLDRNLTTARSAGYVIYVAGELRIIDSKGEMSSITGGRNSSSSSGGGIYVYNGGECTLNGVTVKGNFANDGTSGARGGGVYVAGTLNIENSVIKQNYGYSAGGVYVSSTGTVNFTSGTIEANVGESSSGGGVYTAGKFNMSGGTITQNRGSAGGVFVANGGTFTLTDGYVTDNNGTGGGGVFVYSSASSKFIMQGGTVSGNTGTSAGGVYVAGVAEISGGSIAGNVADATGGSENTSGGGGVYVANSGEATITGGEITGNVGVNGVRVYSSGVLNLGGSAKIHDNRVAAAADSDISDVFLTTENAKYVNIVSEFNGAEIGISRTAAGKFTSGYGTYNTAHPKTYFYSNNKAFSISMTKPANEDEVAEAAIGTPINNPPEADTEKTYNGQKQVIITGYDNTVMTVELPDGVEVQGTDIVAINAGDYNISFTPAAGYCWEDGTVDALVVSAKILQATVTISWTDLEFTYNGEPQKPNATVSAPIIGSDTFALVINGAEVDANLDGEHYTAEVVNLGNLNYTVEGSTGIKQDYVINRADIDTSKLILGKDEVPRYNNRFAPSITNNPSDGEITYSLTAGADNAQVGKDGNYILPTRIGGSITVLATIEKSRNYNSASVSGTFEIEKGIIALIIDDIEYARTGKLLIRDYNADEMGAVTFKNLSGDGIALLLDADGNIRITSVGTFVVTVSITETDYYEGVTDGEIEFKIVPRLVTVQWGDTELDYTGEEQAPSVSITGGILDGDTCTIIDVKGKGKELGDYTASLDDGCLSNGNYTVGESCEMPFTIVQATLTITFKDEVQAKYKTKLRLDADSINGNAGGGAVSYALPDGADATLETEVDEDGNEYFVLIPNALGSLDIIVTVEETDNYKRAEVTLQLDVQKGAVPVELKESTVIYDDTIQLEIKEYGENGTVKFGMEGSPSFATISESGLVSATGIGKFTLTITVGATDNFAETTVGGVEVEILPRPVVLKWTLAEKYVFNGKEQYPDVAVENLVGSDKCEVTVKGATDAGDHTAEAVGLSNPNYTLTGCGNREQGFTIDKATLTITLGSEDIYYNTKFYPDLVGYLPDGKITYTVTNAGGEADVYTDDEGKDYILPTKTGKITLTVNVEGTDNYYAVVDLQFELDVQKGYVPVELVENTTVYGTNLTLALKEYFILPEDEGAVTYAIAAEGSATGRAGIAEGSNILVPTQAGVVYLTITVAETTNYYYTEAAKVPVTISPLAVTVNWTQTEFTYDGTVHTPEAEITNLVNSYDYYDLTIDSPQIDAGTYEAEIVSLGNPNYTVEGASVKCEFTIKPRVAELDWVIGEYTYNGDEQAPEAYVTNLVVNRGTGVLDECTVSVLGTKNAGDKLGAMAVGLSNKNYTLDGAEDTVADYKIAPLQIKIEWIGEYIFTYDGEEHAPEAKALGLFGGDTCEVVITGKQTNVGEYTAVAYDLSNSNYSISELTYEERTAEFEIKRAILEIELGTTSVYYATPTKLEVISEVTLGAGSITYTLEAGTTIATIVGGDTIMGTEIGRVKVTATAPETANYTAATADGYIDIVPRVIEFVWSDTEFEYDGLYHIPAATIANLYADDDIGFTVSSAQKDAAEYTATVTLDKEYEKYTLEGSEFEIKFVINPRVIEVEWAGVDFDDEGEEDEATLISSVVNLVYNGKYQAPDYTITNLVKQYNDDGSEILDEDGNPVYEDCGVKIVGGSGSEGGERNVGTNLTATIDALLNSNYTLDGAGNLSTTFNITALVVEIIWDKSNLTTNGREFVPTLKYSGEEQAPSATIGNLCEGDVCELTINGKQAEVSPSPEYAKDEDGEDIYLGYTAIVAALSNSNYTLVGCLAPSTDYRIIPAEMPVDLSVKVVEYGEELLLDVTGNLENGEIDFGLELGTGNATIEDGTLIPITAGTVTVVINVGATENYVETTKKVEVIIVPKLVNLDWEYLEFTYNGTERKPEATINNLIVKDVDEEGNETYEECTVTAVQGATDAGTWMAYAVTLSNPNYTVYEYGEDGQLVIGEDGKPVNLCFVEFTIVPAVVVIEWGETELKFTGSEQAPEAAVIEDTDGNAIIGECLVTVTGGQTAVGSYMATAFSLSNPNYTLDGAANTTTKFSIVKSKPDIGLENTLATFGETFDIIITGNIGGGEVTYELRDGTGSAVLYGDGLIPTHVGEVTLIVSVGETLNTEEITKEFTITIQKGTLPIKLVKDEVVYGNSLNLAVQYCPDDGSVLFAPGDGSTLEGYDEAALGSAEIEDGVLTALKVGVVYVLVTATETENYVATSATVKVIIKQRVVDLEWTVGDYTYDGTTHTPVATIKNIVEGDECTVEVQGAVNAGDQTVTAVLLIGNDNYTLDGCKNAEITVNIKPRTVEFDWENLTLEYTGKAQVPTAKITNLVSYVDEEGNTVTDECTVNVIALNPDDLTDTDYEAVTVGEYTAFALSVDNTNYTLDGVAEDKLKTLFNIEKAQLVLKVQPEKLTYGVRTKLVLTYLSDGEYVEYTGGDYSFILAATSLAVLDGDGLTIDPVGIGTITLTVNLVETDCYKADTTTTFTVEIQKAPISVELPEASAEIVYGTELLLSVLGNTGSGEVTYTIDESQGKGAAFEIEERGGEYYLVARHGKEYDGKHVGTVYIIVDVAETSLYQASNVTVQVEVTQLTVVLGWYDTELTYNGGRQAPTAKVENLIDGDTCDVYLSESSYKTNASSGNLAYAERLSNSDYSLEGVNKEIVFEIGKKPVTLTLLTTTAYFEVPVLLEVDGNEAGVEIQFGITNGTGAGTLDVREDGVYLNPTKLGTVMITATVEETANYQGATVKGLVVIEKNKMPIELKVTETVYGDDLLLEYEGVIEPTSISVAVTDNTGSAYISGSYLVPRKAGKVILTITTSETTNYQSTMVTVTVTIKPRVIDLEWDNLTFTYDGFEHAPTATPVELLGNDECEVIVVGGKINAGTYPAGTAWAVAVTNSNYTVAENAYAPEFKINKARPPLAITTTTVTINVPAKLTVSGNYGKGNVTFMLENEEDGTVMGSISGDMLTGLVLGQVFVTALVEETENYTAGTASALITIEKPAVEFVLKENTVTYGDELELELVFKDGYTDEGGERNIVIDTENSTGEAQITVTPEGRFVLAALGAGSVRIIVTIQETLTYKTTVKEFDVTVTPNELSIVWEYADEPYVYNGKEQAPTAKVVGLPEGVECEVIVKGNIDAGTGLTATATELSNKNYAIAADAQVVSDTYVIAPRAVEIVWTDTILSYNGEERKPTATISNLVKYTDEDGNELSDECEITVIVTEGSAVTVGTYHAEVSEGESFNPNYTLVGGIDLNSGFEITVRKVGINWVETGLTYNGEEQTPEAQLIDSVSGEVIEDESCEIFMSGAEIHAGTGYTANVTGLSNINYSLDGEYSTTFAINAAKLQLDIGSLQLAYNGKAQTPEVTPQLIKEDDEVTIVFTPSGFTEIGEHTVTLSLGGASASDYYLEENEITFNIVTAQITVTVSSKNKLLESVDEAATLTDWYKLTVEGLTDADAAIAIKEIFEDTEDFTFTPKFLLDGNEVSVGDLQEDVNYLIIPVVTGSSTSENYDVTVVISEAYGTLRISSVGYLQIAEDSDYQFLTEYEENGLYFRRTYDELNWTHGVDDLDLEAFVIGHISPFTTVNGFIANFSSEDLPKIKIYNRSGKLLYDGGKSIDGINSSDYDNVFRFVISTGWYIIYNDFETIYLSVLGDVDGSGTIDANDAAVLTSYIRDEVSFDRLEVRLAAYIGNNVGIISANDCALLISIITNMEDIKSFYYNKKSVQEIIND